MNILTEKHDGKTILSLKEERLEAHNSGELKDRILKLLEDGSHHLILDLAEVRFIDSSGLGALLSGYKNANLRSSSFVLAGLQPQRGKRVRHDCCATLPNTFFADIVQHGASSPFCHTGPTLAHHSARQ